MLYYWIFIIWKYVVLLDSRSLCLNVCLIGQLFNFSQHRG